MAERVQRMNQLVGIGNQDFAYIRTNNLLYIDKTAFIKKWWESGDEVTLITRPRRFGKTLNMDMLNCFFSNKFVGRTELFDSLSIWQEEKYRKLQGTYPVVFMSFASVKADNLQDAKEQIKAQIVSLYEEYRYLLESGHLSENETAYYKKVSMEMTDVQATMSLKLLSEYLYRYYGKKVILILDEYDTPMQEAYVNGYWNAFTSFVRNLFNAAFKSNPYMERGIMTGITRVAKESVFSDLNNLNVITTTSEEYETAFGFTEAEVFTQLDDMGLSEQKYLVKKWYDGFTFGRERDIYNPWSITNFLDKKQIRPYWASTSSNGLVNSLIRRASSEIKKEMEDLLEDREIVVNFDEEIIFDQLDQNENAIWSLLLASGYLRVEQVEYRGEMLEPWYHLRLTNLETKSMFVNMFRNWFAGNGNYTPFILALLNHDVKAMNVYMNEIAMETFSSFDSGHHPSQRRQPERFYHGFVLGLLADLRDRYLLKSNRESGYGRYDVMLIPKKEGIPAVIIEFKVYDPDEEHNLQETAQKALQQIREKKYDTELLTLENRPESIYHYGFAFDGKKVYIQAE